MSASILEELAGRTLQLTICNPAKKNALDARMYRCLAESLRKAESDESICCVLLMGAAQVFCSGNDLGDFAEPSAEAKESGLEFIRTLMFFKKPLIAAVEGPAVGIGATLLLHCDMVFFGASARVSFPFTRIGLCPELGSTLLLPAAIGPHKAAELLLLGTSCTGQQLVDMGFGNQVLPDDEVLGRATSVAETLGKLPSAALQATKSLLRTRAEDAWLRFEDETGHFDRLLQSPQTAQLLQAVHQRAPAKGG